MYKKHNVYSGVWVIPIVLAAVPVGIYFLFHGVFKTTHPELSEDYLLHLSLAFTFLVASCFCGLCILHGFITDLVINMFGRIKELFLNFKLFKGKAVKWYLADFVRGGGIILWIFIAIMVSYIIVCVLNFIYVTVNV